MTRNLKDWLEAYLVYTAESESPEAYHLWVGISTIAGALEREVFFDMGYFLLYSNLFVVLVSPPGRCKKSTAMRMGKRLLAANGKIKFTTDSTSRESLIQDLAQAHQDGQSAMTAFSSEFATMLTTSGMDMVVFLTDIYDSPGEWIHKTKSGGTNKIKAPYLNLIGGTTPDWIARAMPLDTIGIGLTSRIIFVFQDTPRIKPPIPVLSKEQKMLADLLVEDLGQIMQISGEYKLSPDADKWYTEWYTSKTNPLISDTRMSGYFERKPMHLLKVAMVVAASQTDKAIIELEHIERALAIIENNEDLMGRVFAGVGRNPLNADIESVLAMLLSSPQGIQKRELLDMFKHNVRKDELVEVLDTLIETQAIILKADGRYYASNH